MGNGFTSNRCPECGSTTKIKDSRRAENCLRRRRYQCLNGHRYTTIEVLVPEGRGGVDQFKASIKDEVRREVRSELRHVLGES